MSEKQDIAQFCTPDGYEDFVTKLVSMHSMENFKTKLGTMGLGLAGESGEIAFIAIRMQYGNPMTTKDYERILDELSDVCWYVAFAARHVVQVPLKDLVPHYPVAQSHNTESAFLLNSSRLSAACCGVADQVKKLLYHGKEYNDKVRKDLIERLGIVMMNVVVMASEVCGVSFENLITHNVLKLSDRYKSLSFNTEEALAKEARGEE